MHWLNVQTSIHLCWVCMCTERKREKWRNGQPIEKNNITQTQTFLKRDFWKTTTREPNTKKTLMAKHISMHMIFPPTTKSASLIYRKNFFETSILTVVLWTGWPSVCTMLFWHLLKSKPNNRKMGTSCHSTFTHISKKCGFLNGWFNFDCIPHWIHSFRMKELSLEFLKRLCCHFFDLIDILTRKNRYFCRQ